jgi:transposase
VAIETPRGLLVAALRAQGRPVYAINPLAVARYRDRHSVAGRKSDHGDALVLAQILRTDRPMHRPLPDDSEQVRALAVLARAHQDATWRRSRACQELRSLLHSYYPAFLHAFGPKMSRLHTPPARAILALAPTPATAARLSHHTLTLVLEGSGRSRSVEQRASELVAIFAQPQLRQPAPVEQACGEHALALLHTLDAECGNVDQLGTALATTFQQHPDHPILTSFPGLADVLGARILAEIGDDRHRFTTARALKAIAGSAPITRTSGRTATITHRLVKNRRLNAAGLLWASATILQPGPARNHYQRRREHGDRHIAALRHLLNRMLGQLHHCLQTSQTYDPTQAYSNPSRSP